MSESITVANTRVNIDTHPSKCPVCSFGIQPVLRAVSMNNNNFSQHTIINIAYECTHSKCKTLFIASYKMFHQTGSTWVLFDTQPRKYQPQQSDQDILDLSSSFISIFDQASQAESIGLNEICGVGYRKALEFLIKDYCISEDPESIDEIKSMPLGAVIRKFISDSNIQKCATRATWLGNDETHYVRKWDSKDIEDLKILIQLTCSWIKTDVLTKRYLEEMR
jgi:hypothetical protein